MVVFDKNREYLIIPSSMGVEEPDNDFCYDEGYYNGHELGYINGFKEGYEAGIFEKLPMYFVAEEDNCAVSMIHYGGNNPEGLQYTFDGILWNDWDGAEIPLDMGEKMYVRCTKLNHPTVDTNDIYSKFSFAGKVAAYGSVKSIDNYREIPSEFAFYYLFYNSTLTKAPILDFDTVSAHACRYMFCGCKNLEKAPIIYAKNVRYCGCYQMFSGCSKLNELTSYIDEVDLNGWYFCLQYVAPTGVFFNHGNKEWAHDEWRGIPAGWTEVKI